MSRSVSTVLFHGQNVLVLLAPPPLFIAVFQHATLLLLLLLLLIQIWKQILYRLKFEQHEEFTEFLVTDIPSPVVPLLLFETCLWKSECSANTFHWNDFQEILELWLEFWLWKKDFSVEDICNNRSTAGESNNYFVWQWWLYSLSTKLHKFLSNWVLTVFTEK